MSYDDFISRKLAHVEASGFDPGPLAGHLFPFQADLVRWALRRGRAALFADTGLGKTAMQIEWARQASEHAGGPVLILAPLAVVEQTVTEGERFGVLVEHCRHGNGARQLQIANYEMLHRFDPSRYAGVVLDESSILKSYDGATRNAILAAFGATPYRLACTATPAPNDYTELGNHSEFLGIKSRTEMLAEYFVHDGGSTQDWRLKGHAEEPFWQWVCRWAAMVKRPSDLGYDDERFALPPLRMHERVVRVEHADFHREGLLFAPTATTLDAQRATRRATVEQRVRAAAEIAGDDGQCLVWCELNAEADAVTAAIPGAVQVAGADSPEEKAERMLAFARGKVRVLVSKPSVCGFGMNFQACARMVFMGASHSFEQTYQAVRRCWRFGQSRPVDVYVIRAENEDAIVANYRRKESDVERLSERMVEHMRATMREEISSSRREWNEHAANCSTIIPDWLRTEAA